MNCRTCGAGSERGSRWVEAQGRVLCIMCEMDAPPRLNRAEFDIAFWGGAREKVPADIRRESYEDYLSSGLQVRDYIVRSMDPRDA